MLLDGSSGSKCNGDKERKRQKNESECKCNETERCGNISGISYGPRGRVVDKLPQPQGSRRGGVFKVSPMFLDFDPEEIVQLNFQYKNGHGGTLQRHNNLDYTDTTAVTTRNCN